MEINEKSAMMHTRKRRLDRCAAAFKIGINEIPWVSSYKYLGCVIDELLNCARMDEHRVHRLWAHGHGGAASWRGEWQILSTTFAVFGGAIVRS